MHTLWHVPHQREGILHPKGQLYIYLYMYKYILLLYLSLFTSTRCILCTVTGPSVVDVHGIVNSVEDRCGYTLMKTSSIPDLQVRATFQERRRTDVSFLDTVILSLDTLGVQINLEQGGRVKVSYTVLQTVGLRRFTLMNPLIMLQWKELILLVSVPGKSTQAYTFLRRNLINQTFESLIVF